MTVYISGKITGDSNYRDKFALVERNLIKKGYDVVNPCHLGEYDFFSYEQYMHVDFALIDVCDAIYMLKDWTGSSGARREKEYAEKLGKKIMYEPL